MTEQPEALRLADLIQSRYGNDINDEAAAELRRLYAKLQTAREEAHRDLSMIEDLQHSNMQLLEALEKLVAGYEGEGYWDDPDCIRARAAIKAAKGEA